MIEADRKLASSEPYLVVMIERVATTFSGWFDTRGGRTNLLDAFLPFFEDMVEIC